MSGSPRSWIRYRVGLGALLAAASLSPAFAQAGDDDLDDAPAIEARELSPDEEAALRHELATPPPEGLSEPQLDAWYADRHQRAARLGGRAAYQVSEQWHQRMPQSGRATWSWARAQFHFGRASAFERLAQEAFDLAPRPAHKARVAAESALALAEEVADLDGAERWIARGDTALGQVGVGADRHAGGRRGGRGRGAAAGPGGGNGEMAEAFGIAELSVAKAQVQLLRGHFVEAMAAARASIDAAQAMQRQAAATGRDRTVNTARSALARAWLGLAQVQLKAGFNADAELGWRRADGVIAGGPTGHKVRMDALEAGVGLRLAQGRFGDAERLARQLVELTSGRRTEPPSANHIRARLKLQDALAGQQRWADAWAAMQATDARVVEAPDLAELGQNALVRGWVLLSLGQPAQALAVLQGAYQRAQQLGPAHVDTALAGGLYAWALWDTGARDEALRTFDAVMPKLVAPQGSARGYFDFGLQRPLRKVIAEAYLRAAASDPARAAGALRAADWLMGAAVQQALAEAASRATVPPEVAPLLRAEQDLQHRLQALRDAQQRAVGTGDGALEPESRAALARQLREVGASHESALAALDRAWPPERRADAVPPVDTRAIATRLTDGEVFALLLPTADATYLWTVDATAQARFSAVAIDERRVAALVARVRASLDFGDRGRPPRFDAEAAGELHAALIEPLAGSLRGRQHLVAAAGGALGRLPLALLAPPATAGSTPRWLIGQMAISQAPSAGAWLALGGLRQGDGAREALLGWGDPLFDPTTPGGSVGGVRRLALRRTGDALDYARIPPLPETRDELRAIAAALHATPARDLYLGERATRESVLLTSRQGDLARRRVVVFATHGLMAGDLPGLNQPALALATTPGAAQDPLSPLLTLDDVLGLKLDADWVVLSACNTAAADGKSEEALSGLARGFFYAGARSLLVTHWAVETESAQRLTAGTFEHHSAHPQVGKAESLRQSMLKLMREPQFAHPAYWAPYALVGDGGH